MIVRYKALSLFLPVMLVCGTGTAWSATPEELLQSPVQAALSTQEEEGILQDQQDESSLKAVLRYAYQHNPYLRAARTELQAVNEQLPQAMAGWRPTIGASGTISSVDTDGSFYGAQGSTSKTMGVSFSQPLFRGLRTIAATKGAQATIEAQRYLLADTEQNLLYDVAAAYMDVVRDRAIVDLREQNEQVLRKQKEATKARYDVGDVTKTDLAQAEARLAQAEADQIRARGDLQGALAVYEQLVGQKAGALDYPDNGQELPETLDESMAIAEGAHPLILAGLSLHRAAEEDVDKRFGELLPEISFDADWDRTYDPQPGLVDETTNRSVGLSASIPLYRAGNTRSQVRQAKYTANQRYIELLDTRRKVRQGVIAAWENWMAVKAEIISRRAQVDAARLAREGVYAESEVGARTILDTLDADQELLQAQVDLVGARRDEIVALFSLWSAMGLLTPTTLGFPELASDHDLVLQDTKSKILGMDVDIERNRP